MKRMKNSGFVYSGDPASTRKLTKKTYVNRAKKQPWLCEDGPYKGQKLWLTDGTTMVFSANNQTGRYVNGQWQSC